MEGLRSGVAPVKPTGVNFKDGGLIGRIFHLASHRVLHSHEAHVIDKCVREVVPGRRKADVDLPGQVRQHCVPNPKVGDHVVDSCSTQQGCVRGRACSLCPDPTRPLSCVHRARCREATKTHVDMEGYSGAAHVLNPEMGLRFCRGWELCV